MNQDFELVGAMLALAVCAVMLVTGQQYLLKHPEAKATSVQLPTVVSLLPSN